MSLGFALLLSTAASVAPGCSWDHPDADPYRGSLTAALADFEMTPATRDKLRAALEAHRYDDIVTITRDRIAGSHAYDHLREMHSGNGQHCRGEVDRSGWAPERRELGLVYCADDACVLVPTICNNISLVTRSPEVALEEPGPIDIEPAAGPGVEPAPLPPTAEGEVGAAPVPPPAPSQGWPSPWGGGGILFPLPPVVPPPVASVPEPDSALLWLSGLVAVGLTAWRRHSHATRP